MGLTLRWVGRDEADQVADVRLQCYGAAVREREHFAETMRLDQRVADRGFLIAEQDGASVGTATYRALTMWVRGRPFACQGVGWVGTIKTERRRAARGGVATAIMQETLRCARERGDVVSSLMAFRPSFYERFGYGLVERRHEWTIPLSVLPAVSRTGFRFHRQDDLAGMVLARQRMVQSGQAEIERPAEAWPEYFKKWEAGFVLVAEDAEGWMAVQPDKESTRNDLVVVDAAYDGMPALLRQLTVLANMKDQHPTVRLTLPADIPLHRLLAEPQTPHVSVNHPAATCRVQTRMQLRVLDHRMLLDGQPMPDSHRGRVVVSIRETEGHESRLLLELDGGRISVSQTGRSPDVVCLDRVWSGLVTGDLPARDAERLGLVESADSSALDLLSVFSVGPLPFCHDFI
jgi:predicted acetyltransferase